MSSCPTPTSTPPRKQSPGAFLQPGRDLPRGVARAGARVDPGEPRREDRRGATAANSPRPSLRAVRPARRHGRGKADGAASSPISRSAYSESARVAHGGEAGRSPRPAVSMSSRNSRRRRPIPCGSPRRRSSGRWSSVIPFETEAEAVRPRQRRDLRLAAGVWTATWARAHGESASAGTIWMNTSTDRH